MLNPSKVHELAEMIADLGQERAEEMLRVSIDPNVFVDSLDDDTLDAYLAQLRPYTNIAAAIAARPYVICRACQSERGPVV